MGVRLLRAVVALVLLSLLAACGGGGGDERTSADGTSSTTTTPDGVGVGEGGGGDSTGAPSGTPTTGASGSSGSGSGSKPGTAATGSGASGGTSPATTGTTSPPPPRTGTERTATAGTYTYNRTRDGSPTQGTLVVHPPDGADQRTVTTYPGGEASEAVTRTRSGGIDLVMLKTTTPLLGTKEFRPSPPVQFAPDPATVGATWSWRITSTDGSRTLDGTFKVVRTERIDIGGEQVDTLVIDGTVHASGDFVGTLHQTTWASTRYRLLVRLDERLESAFARYSQSATLTSTRPT